MDDEYPNVCKECGEPISGFRVKIDELCATCSFVDESG